MSRSLRLYVYLSMFIISAIACGLPNWAAFAPAPSTAPTDTPVAVGEAATETPTETETVPTETATATATNTATNVPMTATPDCTDAAEFAEDVTIPDGTIVEPGSDIEKTWRLRNTGTCTWNKGYSLDYFGGKQMGGSVSKFLEQNVAPGATVDITIAIIAPSTPGTYAGEWRMHSPINGSFGDTVDIQIKALEPTPLPTATATMTRTPSPTPVGFIPSPTATTKPTFPTSGTGWRGEYHNNRNLGGSIVFVRYDKKINFDWGGGSPDPSVPVDQFSVRWTRTIDFAPGTYRFTMSADDGMRLSIDGTILIDSWIEKPYRTIQADITLSGKHKLIADYFEAYVEARVQLTWQKQ